MVFLGGPRQVGKTTFAQGLIPSFRDGSPAYLNWDSSQDRKTILEGGWPSKEKLVVFDEIHKFSKWRGLIKGYYDKLKGTHQFLVTGSARLDYYRKSGDSLLGRYHYYRMHPLSLPELGMEHLKELIHFGGFPEPFLRQKSSTLRRWHLQRRERIIYSDVRDLERVNEISHLELLANALPDRVGSPLSRKNLAEDLQVDFKTVERWVSILENVYYCFRIAPFGAPRLRAVKKEQKLYLWDWSELTDEGKRWENFVASHLLKYCHYLQDTEGHLMELRFLRDVNGREVDFVVLKDKNPVFAVECKAGEKSVSPHLSYFAERTNIPIFYQVHLGKKDFSLTDSIRVLPFAELCRVLALV
jgi:predicted AAA+ superfamily ATPase